MASTSSLKVDKLFSVKDYVCLVTGGGTGIGLMATQALAANGTRILLQATLCRDRLTSACAGAKVYITGRRMEVLENAAKTHTPGEAGEIIPYAVCMLPK